LMDRIQNPFYNHFFKCRHDIDMITAEVRKENGKQRG
jgi:hypothetical protein